MPTHLQQSVEQRHPGNSTVRPADWTAIDDDLTWKVSAETAHPQRIDQAMAGAIGSPPESERNCHEHLG
jgi:hypothetical protein